MQRRISLLLILAIVAVLSLAQNAIVYTPRTVPNPKTATADGWISDPAGYIDHSTRASIEQVCEELKKSVEVETAVVMLPAIDPDYDAFTFCQELFNLWGIGDSEKNRGLLIFFCDGAAGQRDIRIHTGGGLEGLLPDATCNEIIDSNIDYLLQNQYATGVMKIAEDVQDHLLTDAAKAELLLGWKPRENNSTGFNYLICAFLALIILTILAYKRLNGKKGQSREEIITKAAGAQTAIGALSFVFPFPVALLYLYYKSARKNIRYKPVKCTQCGNNMKILSKADAALRLSAQQLTEERIGAAEHDVWECPNCKHTATLTYKGSKAAKYSQCPSCGAQAFETKSSETVNQPTYQVQGLRRDHKLCASCGYMGVVAVTLPKLVRAATSGTTGGFGGGSRGGGFSGGSWGGGSSFGGGAGRRF